MAAGQDKDYACNGRRLEVTTVVESREKDAREVDGGSVKGGRRVRGVAAGPKGSWSELARGTSDTCCQRIRWRRAVDDGRRMVSKGL